MGSTAPMGKLVQMVLLGNQERRERKGPVASKVRQGPGAESGKTERMALLDRMAIPGNPIRQSYKDE
jgi:hypothetical protein